MKRILTIVLSTLSIPLLTAEQAIINNQQEECFSVSMIGYDYVINSRAGLPIERALNTVTVDKDSDIIRDAYKNNLKTIVKSAYQWQDSPHNYAVKVMYECAFNHGAVKSAS